jgi:hypothetical protein
MLSILPGPDLESGPFTTATAAAPPPREKFSSTLTVYNYFSYFRDDLSWHLMGANVVLLSITSKMYNPSLLTAL